MLRGRHLQKHGPVSLEQLAQVRREQFPREWAEKSPFLDPGWCAQQLAAEHKRLGIDYSSGGYLENRSCVWSGSYLARDERFIHLGIDVNVPAGTLICADNEGHVVAVDTDCPEEYGWGTRVIVRLANEPVYLVYGHLAARGIIDKNERVQPGSVLGVVGDATCNGGWYPHVHVQAMTEATYHFHLVDALRNLDGYGRMSEQAMLAQQYPNPSSYIRLP